MHHHYMGLLCCLLRQASTPRYQRPTILVNNAEEGEAYVEARSEERRKYRNRCLKGLGFTQIIIGTIGLVLGVILFVLIKKHGVENEHTSSGLWGNGAILVASTFTIALGMKPEQEALKPLSIIFNIIAVVASGIAGLMLQDDLRKILEICDEYRYVHVEHSIPLCGEFQGIIGGLVAVMATCFIVGIVAASYSCPCCCRQDPAGGVVVQTQQPATSIIVSTEMSATICRQPQQQYNPYPQCMPYPYNQASPPPYTPHTNEMNAYPPQQQQMNGISNAGYNC